MLYTEDEVITGEIYFEQQAINDRSLSKFRNLLITIKNEIEAGTPIKKIKKIIDTSDINADMQDTLQEIAEQQISIITGEESSVNLAVVGLAGYTLKEAVSAKKESVKKQAQRFMANANELLKDKEDLTTLLKDEVSKYERELEAFYRTQTKQARQQGYEQVDKNNSEQIRGWISITILDNRTSAICLSYQNQFYSIKDYKTRADIPNPPPRHPHCRSILITVWEGVNITKYKGQKLSTFLKNNPKVAEDILGKKKYRIFTTGKAQINSFIDVKGKRFYTNEEIIQRLGIKSKTRLDKIGGK